MRRYSLPTRTGAVWGPMLALGVILAMGGLPIAAQQAPPASQPTQQAQAPPPPPPGQVLNSQQLDDLVAPIALYPDPLVSQILVASTYPLELVQLQQWLDRNPGLSNAALVQAVGQQNWDPSIQAMAVFPDLVKRLNQDISWTTNLGNTFLAQQGDVMDAIQRMRVTAQQAGKLSTTPQQTVTTSTSPDTGRPVVEIQPANPDVIYVPYYDPYSIWGPPLYYPYASWYYPPFYGGAYFGFGFGIRIGGFFGGGWGGWGGWGWSPFWGGRSIIVNNNFIHRNNFNTYAGGRLSGTSAWAHDSVHRQGVPYSNASLNSRYSGGVRQNLSSQSMARPASPSAAGAQRMGSRSVAPNVTANRGAFGGVGNGSAARAQSDHGYSSMGPTRSATPRSSGSVYAAPSRSASPSARSSGGGGVRSSGGGGARSSGGSRGGGGSHGGGHR